MAEELISPEEESRESEAGQCRGDKGKKGEGKRLGILDCVRRKRSRFCGYLHTPDSEPS
jgi:hypothetical protein